MSKRDTITISQLLNNVPGGRHSEAARRIMQSYEFARRAHNGRQRESGEYYIEHDIAVAHTVSHVISDLSSITAGLLHDTLLPHTGTTETSLYNKFGQEVTALVTGLAKLTPYTELKGDRRESTVEAMRHAILAIVERDVRIILIAMADCLQDLRKAKHLDRAKQQNLAIGGMNIYAPLANRLGIWGLKWELEDLSFRYLEPERYSEIARFLSERREERSRSVRTAIHKLQERLQEAGIPATVTGRPKHIYSIYRKLQRKQVELASIYDLQAVRVILETGDKNQCYQVLGIVHDLWQPVPQEFDDYIARPKQNGYQSLHTAVIDSKNETLEVQIRTRKMHEEAEKGVAAHWVYKEGSRQSGIDQRQIEWLRQLLSSYQETANGDIDTELLATEVMAERIYVFTPKGDVIDLPLGATPIDFAYHIHTQVGHRCRGAKVNGKMTSLDYNLKSGDKVEIITSSRGGPSRDWMNESLGYAASARTRSRIRQWFREQEREQNIQQGREVVERELKRLGLADVYTIEDITQALHYDEVEEFLAKVGFGDIQSAQLGGAISAMQQKLKPDDELRPLLQSRPKAKGLTVTGVGGLHTKMARCCNPIPPESIRGYVTRGHGITVHRDDCKQLLAVTEKERLIEVEWGVEEDAYAIPIVIKAYRRPGLMEDIANLLRGQRISLSKTKTATANSVATIYLVVEITSLDQLNWLLQKLENLPNVLEAHRQRWVD